MAKKFGKIMLFTAAVGTAAAAAYYFMHKKSGAAIPEDEDFDDFGKDTEEDTAAGRNYVPLTPDTKDEEAAAEPSEKAEAEPGSADGQETQASDSFIPLSEHMAQAGEKVEEAVEEFFDEEDGPEEEPPLSDQ
ncbi:MAG: hypothetical protein K2O06_12790 [Acetatifactor sp.]|nr:hypothetical protein [Acetatifactor sp.]